MSLLRRAAIESIRALGVNTHTVLLALVGIGLSLALASFYSEPATSSPSAALLWLLKSLVWAFALIITASLLLGWQIVRIKRQDRVIQATRQLALEGAASRDEQIKSFLRHALQDNWYGVKQCFVFGSIVGGYPARDVDIIVQFDSADERGVRAKRDRLRRFESDFREFHEGLGLHVQTFLSTEDDALQNFIGRTGAHQRLI